MEECLTCINCKCQKWEVYQDRFKCSSCGHEVKLLIRINYEPVSKIDLLTRD